MSRAGGEPHCKCASRRKRVLSGWHLLIPGVLALTGMASPALATGAEEFYKGRTVSLIIGYSVGGGYDLYGRLLARHIAKYIPGHPTIVPQNLTGAGSLRAASYLYSAAPRDGSAFGTFGRTIATTPLLMPSNVAFDPTKLTWLGSITNEVSTCVTWHSCAVKRWQDSLQTAITMGGEGSGADPDVYALLYKNVFGAKWKLITGYHGTTDTILAMERGEVDGLCGLSWSTLKSRHQQLISNKLINIIVQAALKKEPELAQVPLATELTKDSEQQQILKLFLSTQEMARPFAAPPDIPADRKMALISAFEQTMRDPEFLAEAKKQSMDVNPLSASSIEQLIAELYATPKHVVDKAAQAMTK
jgi:tripartite-type tricarboxylate transporter receptor subunit TctC